MKKNPVASTKVTQRENHHEKKQEKKKWRFFSDETVRRTVEEDEGYCCWTCRRTGGLVRLRDGSFGVFTGDPLEVCFVLGWENLPDRVVQ